MVVKADHCRRGIYNAPQNHHTINDEHKNLFPQDDVIPSSSTSEDDSEKKQQKKLNKKKIRKRISKFFRLKLEKEQDKEGHGAYPQRPYKLSIEKEPEASPAIISPSKLLHYTIKLHNYTCSVFAAVPKVKMYILKFSLL